MSQTVRMAPPHTPSPRRPPTRRPPTRRCRAQIFAVLQWELEDGITKEQAAEKLEDLDFAAVVKATEAFVLVGTHVEAVAQLSNDDAVAKLVPPEAKELSAFFRVWCLVEMAAALQAAKPVVLLVGKAASGEELRFEPNMAMLNNLFYVMDIRQAAASREEDRVRPRRPRRPPSAAPRASHCVPAAPQVRILKEVDEGVGADALNTLARGAVMGAGNCMEEREVLSSAMGNDAPLAALQEPEDLMFALIAAAAAGLMAPLKALLGRSDEVAVEATLIMVLWLMHMQLSKHMEHKVKLVIPEEAMEMDLLPQAHRLVVQGKVPVFSAMAELLLVEMLM